MSETISRVIGPRWIVLKRVNGSFEPMGPLIEGHDNRGSAAEAAKKLAQQHQGQMFTVMKLDSQFVYEPVMVESEVERASTPKVVK